MAPTMTLPPPLSTDTATVEANSDTKNRNDISWPRETLTQAEESSGFNEQEPTGGSSSVFDIRLRNYLQARGIEQANKRSLLADDIRRSRCPEDRVRQVLDEIDGSPGSDTIIAAIDLLQLAPRAVRQMALEKAMVSKGACLSGSSSFVLASAALECDKSLLVFFLGSEHYGIREAAVEAAADLPPEKARTLLARVGANDPNEVLRALAIDYLEDLGEV